MKFTMISEIELDDNPLNWKLQALEEQILEKSREAAKNTFLDTLAAYEKKLLKWRPREWSPKDRLSKMLKTRFGQMKYERYRVWDSKEKRSRYPLDEALGIGKWKRETLDFKNIAINQSVQRSYGQSRVEVFNQTGVSLSKMSLWHVVQKESQSRQKKKEIPMKWKRLALPASPQSTDLDPCPALGIDLDGTYCRSWKKKKKIEEELEKIQSFLDKNTFQGRSKIKSDKKNKLLDAQ